MQINEYTILIADDSELTLKIIKEILETIGSGVKLIYAADGKKACELALSEKPDLILMDVIMPEMNGIEAVKFLKSHESTSEIPVMVLSASESLNSAFDAGANDYISKPFQKYELLIKVRSALHLVQKIKEIQLKKEELEKQQKDTLDDINYSKRIQYAVLPSDAYMNSLLPENFILNLPKNIVGGDFYWVYETPGKKVIAVGDCTGHGISGAFMTMAGIAFLNEIVNTADDLTASKILFDLRKMIMKLLKQKGEEGEAADGMDISLIIMDTGNRRLQYSGANSSLYIIRDENLEILKGNRMPVGIHVDFDKPFTDINHDIRQGDMLYMFTDGYADQFGGPNNKKFRYNNFQDLLLSVHKQKMEEQKNELLRTITTWKGINRQVDDILILGFRIDE